MTVATFGVVLVLAPIPFALSLVAWRRSRRDRVFWIGLASNATLLLGFVVLLVVLVTGNAPSD
jgi:amino acid transporter